MVDAVDQGALAPDRKAVGRWEAALANAARAAGPPLLFGLRLWASVCLALYIAFWLELDNASLGSASMTWARQLAAGPTQVINGIKLQANLEARGGIAAADARQVEINDMIWKARDRQRGVDAFFASGPATAAFQGD